MDIAKQAVRQLVGHGQVLASDCSASAAAGFVADAFELVPRVDHPDFIDAMLEIVRRESISLVVPTIDTELLVLAQNADAFTALGAVVLVSDPEAVRITSDKEISSTWLSTRGFPRPAQYSIEDALDGLTGWPLFFKPKLGSGSIGARKVESQSQLRLCVEAYDGVLEGFAPGPEYTVDVYVDRNGRARSAVPRERIETRAGEVSKGITRRRNDLSEVASGVAEALPGSWGPITVQLIEDSDGNVLVMEVNPRLAGGFPLSHHAGARHIEAALAESLGLECKDSMFDWKEGRLMLRFDRAVYLPNGQAVLDEAH